MPKTKPSVKLKLPVFDPRKRGALCDHCPRRNQPKVPPEGKPERAKAVWLGQDPGDQEVRHGQPFIGPTGSRLTRIWEEGQLAVGQPVPTLNRADVWITNAALCPPMTKSAAEATQAVDCCRPRLLRELKLLDRNLGILVMGKYALYALTGKVKGMGKLTGFHIPVSLVLMDRLVTATQAKIRSGKWKVKRHAKEEDIPF